MKCDKLKACNGDVTIPVYGTIADAEVYLKKEADKALAEKDKEIALLKERICNGDVSRITWIDDCIAKDKEIAELKEKLMPCLNGDCILTCEVVEKYGKENAELKAKLENVQASMYADVVDAGMRERRLRRALWLKRADDAKHLVTAYENYDYLDCQKMTIKQETARTWMTCKLRTAEEWVKVWKNIERKCLEKAEEYK